MTNELIAEKVMGWEAYVEFRGGYNHVCFVRNAEGKRKRDKLKNCPSIAATDIDSKIHIVHMEVDFLTDMNAAMMVVEKMSEKDSLVAMYKEFTGKYVVKFENPDGTESWSNNNDSLPTAICTAALKAMEAL